MKLVEFSVRNFQFTVVIFLMLIGLGWTSWNAIPRGEDPVIPIPGFSIVAIYPGATPTDIEQLIVDPIEERMYELDEVKEITTRIEEGVAVIWIEFDAYADAGRKREEVHREVNALRPGLPADMLSLDVLDAGAEYVAIAQIALVSENASFHELDQYAERLEAEIEKVRGVKRAEVWGIPQREVRVSLDLPRLAELNLNVSQVLAAIGSEDINIPGGTVDIGTRRLSVKGSGNYTDIEEVRNTVIGGARGRLIRLRDVARVEWDYADRSHVARYNGRRAVFVTATMQGDQNIARVHDGIYEKLDAFETSLPPTIVLERGFDQSRNVSRRLNRLGEDFIIAIALVLVTLLPLGVRASGIVMISIPLSLAIGLALLNFTGFSINQLSIVGFVIALGLLVDDSIVVVENIARFLREGHSRRDAAILATKQITVAVLGATATLILAFVPLMFLPGLSGMYIRSLPMAVLYTILASLFVSLTIIPWLASLLLKDNVDPHGNRAFRAFTAAISKTYAPLLGRALQRPVHTVVIAGLMFAGSLALVPVVGFSLFPKAGTPQFLVDIETPAGTSLEETDRIARDVERRLAAREQVRSVFSNVGRGNPQVYYNVIPVGERSNQAQLFVLIDAYDADHTPALLDSLRAEFAHIPGAKIQVHEFENGPPIEAPIALRIFGDNLDTLRSIAAQVESAVRTTPGTQYVENPLAARRSDLALAIDRQKAGLLGVPTAEIDRTVRLAIAGLPAGRVRDSQGDEYPIIVRLPHAGAPVYESLWRIHLASVSGGQIPLRQIAEVEFAASPSLIQHYDKQRAVAITSFVQTGFNTDRVTKEVLDRLARIELPDGYSITAAGEIESRQESFGGIGSAIIIATFSILAILILEFRTFRSTLIVASVIPLGVVGGIIALLLSGYTLSFMSMIGFVALIGIEIKTSILLVDFTNQLRREGVPIDDAIRKAGEVRFVPIVLTTLTAIGGLLPLAMQGSGLYSPLAWVIIGGLISSTVLARLLTPVMYKLLRPAVW